MKFDARKDKIINHIKVFGRITSSGVQTLVGVHRNTALKDLKRLQQENIIQSFGEGKGTYYQLVDQIIFEPQLIQELFSKKQKTSLERYFRQPNRKPVFFDKIENEALTAKFFFPDQFNQKADELKTLLVHIKKELSIHEQKRKKQRLVVDLSWASSHIEGNTYSLLETESLIEHQETAHGKKYVEAKMILNHKEAIEYIREYKHYKILSKKNIFELHQILVDGLSVQTGLRKHLVRISNSVYVPCDNEFQITQTLDKIIQAINATSSVLQKAIMANLLIAFLQPFADGNKRTSRMLGNAILVSHGLLPISFSHTPKDDYLKSVLYFYEEQDPTFFIILFFQELNTSFLEYIE
jgi:Fic family protein